MNTYLIGFISGNGKYGTVTIRLHNKITTKNFDDIQAQVKDDVGGNRGDIVIIGFSRFEDEN